MTNELLRMACSFMIGVAAGGWIIHSVAPWWRETVEEWQDYRDFLNDRGPFGG